MALTRTVRQVIDVAQEMQEADAGRMLQLFNEAHLYIVTQVRLVPDTTVQVLLTAGQQEYSLPDSVAKIWDASYFSAPTSWTPILAKNTDSLFEDLGPNWQLQSAAQPWAFYERGGMVGFAPTPNATSSGGYPSVTLFVTQSTSLGLDDTLPTNISSIYPWVYRMCELGAMGSSGDLAERITRRDKFHALFEEQMYYLRQYMYGRVARDRARVAVRVPRLRRC